MDLNELVANVLEINIKEVVLEMSPQNTPEWTSLKQIKLISEIEQNYGIKFSFKEMKQLKSMKMYVDILQAKGIEVSLSE